MSDEVRATCYHCDLPIVKLGGYWEHESVDAYLDWLSDVASGTVHPARYEPACTHCGRDNANGTHTALTRTGHLDHEFLAHPPETEEVESSR